MQLQEKKHATVHFQTSCYQFTKRVGYAAIYSNNVLLVQLNIVSFERQCILAYCLHINYILRYTQ